MARHDDDKDEEEMLKNNMSLEGKAGLNLKKSNKNTHRDLR